MAEQTEEEWTPEELGARDARLAEMRRETLARVRRLVIEHEETIARLTVLAANEPHPPTAHMLRDACTTVRGQLGADRKWLADLEERETRNV
jgi:hypothetical protein